MNKTAFYWNIKHKLFGGKLRQGCVDTMESIFYQCKVKELHDYRVIAYILATAYHESYNTQYNPDWEPPREGYARNDAEAIAHVTALYKAKKIKINYAIPNKQGLSYYARGFAGITWEDNYKRLSTIYGFDLVNNPDKALERPVAATLLVDCMKKGWFTGKQLADYITERNTDFEGARRIINGEDKAEQIAEYAKTFYQAIIQLWTHWLFTYKLC